MSTPPANLSGHAEKPCPRFAFSLKEASMRGICLLASLLLVAPFFVTGCGKKMASSAAKSTPDAAAPPSVAVKRVPCRIKLGPLAAALEVDLTELKNVVLDAKQLYNEIVNGEPAAAPPEKGQPVIVVVNKRDHRITYLQLAPNVKEIRLKTKESKEVARVVQNQDPLRIELWVDTQQDVMVDVEFKDAVSPERK
jgi:hypothetical protein